MRDLAKGLTRPTLRQWGRVFSDAAEICSQAETRAKALNASPEYVAALGAQAVALHALALACRKLPRMLTVLEDAHEVAR